MLSTVHLQVDVVQALLDRPRLVRHESEGGDGALLAIVGSVQENESVDNPSGGAPKELGHSVSPGIGVRVVDFPARLRHDSRAQSPGGVEASAGDTADAIGRGEKREADRDRGEVASATLGVHGGAEDCEDEEERGNELDAKDVAGGEAGSGGCAALCRLDFL